MAFAGDHHVVVAIIAHLAGAACFLRDQGAGDGQCVALAFLTAEPAAHPADFNAHGMHRQAKGIGHLVLDFRRVLGRGMDDHVTVILRQGKGGLTFQIEMLLPAHLDLAFDDMRCGFKGLGSIAFLPDARALFEVAIGGEGVFDGQDRGCFGVVDLGQSGGAAGGMVAVGHDQKQRLTEVVDRAIRQQRFVVVGGRAIRRAIQIGGGDNIHDAFGAADL